ncbi:MAG: L,D-transpeptidase family protein [Pyrinomonadaceae bacterium]
MRKTRRQSIILVVGIVFAIVAAISILSQIRSSEMDNKPLTTLAEPSILIRKAARKLEIFDGKKLVKTYTMVLGFSTKGDKEIEGDGRTPEGEFYVFTKNPESRFHLSLGISYPSKDDAKRGLSAGLISKEEHAEIAKAIDEGGMPPQKTKLGGEIFIHGGGTASDWTDGCVALKDEEISEIFAIIPVGTKVKILK